MKHARGLITGLLALAVSAMTVQAFWLEGYVKCCNGTAARGVVITLTETNGAWSGTGTTDGEGFYSIEVPEAGYYRACVDTTTLPAGAVLEGSACVEGPITDCCSYTWWLSGHFCESGVCWLTGGGAWIDPLLNIPVAEIRGKGTAKTPDIAFGGNVYPGCSPTAGDGGSWNHVDRRLQLHFHGTSIQVVDCGNVIGIPPGSESPVTMFNYIEFRGTGWLKGLKGNKTDMLVTFYARCEDHNEPGSKGAKDGALIDRYYLQVVGNGSVQLQVGSGNPPTATTESTIQTIAITDGNLQLHQSSCDNPPTP